MDLDIVGISRLQFAGTAFFHFIFVPMTLGLSILVAVMETIYVATRRPVWRQITKFFGALFGINFAVGVGSGLVMEFQFGMNWSYYSHYMGDIFGAPLAFEALMAFFLEATLVGMFYFGWERISTKQHLIVTWAMAVGTNLSAMWILIANGWMQFPTAATINPYTMRMEMASVLGVIFSPVAQAKFLHVVTAGYTYAALFVIGVSSWFLLKKRHQEMARRSIVAAAGFGLVGSIALITMGDVSGIHVAEKQPMKMATIEGIWETEPAPAPFTVIAFPDQQARDNHFAIKIPAVLGLITTHSTSKEIPGIKELIATAQQRVQNGIVAYDTMMNIQEYGKARQEAPAELLSRWNDTYKDLGYALLLKRYVDDPRQASGEQIMKAAEDTLPVVWPLFWSFRIMVGLGFFFFALIVAFFYHAIKGNRFEDHPLLLRLAVLAIPLPVVACEMGWFVAEYGRQPWAVEGSLPVAVAVSDLSAAVVFTTVLGFIAIYSILFVIMVKLMFATVRKGPDPRELQPLPGDISMPGLSATANA